MNWLDWALLALLAFAAVRGFMRGFIVEVASLLGLVIGIWAAVHFSAQVGASLHLDPEHETLSFIITLLAVLVLVHLLARAVTKAIDIAQLSLPNKVAGVLFGAIRKAFMLSVLLNILFAKEQAGWPPDQATREGSALYAPMKAFAPMIVPALGSSKWMKKAVQDLENEASRLH